MRGLSRQRRRIHCRVERHLHRRVDRDTRLRILWIRRDDVRIGSTHARPIAHRSAILRTRGSQGQGRVLRYTRSANIVRTLLSVVRKIRVIDDRDGIAHAIALLFLTVSGGLHGERRTGGGVGKSAHSAIARARGAFGVHAWAIGARDALDAHAGIAERASTLGAWTLIGFVGVRGHSIEANLIGAFIAVIGRNVHIVDDGSRGSHPIAHDCHAIARSLSRHDGAHGRIVHAAFVHAARAHLAFGVLAGTIRSHEAFDAGSSAIAERASILVACGARGGEGMVRHSIGTRFARALTSVICRKIRIVRACRDPTGAIALRLLTVAHLSAVDERPSRSVLHAAGSCVTRSCLTNRVLTLAIRRRIAAYTDAIAIADQIHHRAASCTFRDVREVGNAIQTRFVRAFDTVIGHIGIIGGCRVDARDALRLPAITGIVRCAWRGDSIEQRKDANVVIARFGCARIGIIAIRSGFAGDASTAAAAHAAHSSSAAHAPFTAAAASAAAAR